MVDGVAGVPGQPALHVSRPEWGLVPTLVLLMGADTAKDQAKNPDNALI